MKKKLKLNQIKWKKMEKWGWHLIIVNFHVFMIRLVVIWLWNTVLANEVISVVGASEVYGFGALSAPYVRDNEVQLLSTICTQFNGIVITAPFESRLWLCRTARATLDSAVRCTVIPAYGVVHLLDSALLCGFAIIRDSVRTVWQLQTFSHLFW